jgi:hypothetical protein
MVQLGISTVPPLTKYCDVLVVTYKSVLFVKFRRHTASAEPDAVIDADVLAEIVSALPLGVPAPNEKQPEVIPIPAKARLVRASAKVVGEPEQTVT